MPSKLHLVLIGDLVRSRDIRARAAVQRRLSKALTALNRSTRPLSPFTITLGDEFQAVLRDATGVFSSLFTIQREIWPARARYSLGVGRLETPINSERAIGMDGPAFHRARAGIDDMKSGGSLFRISGLGREQFEWLDSALDLVSHSVRDWKPRRFAIALDWINGRPADEIAARVGISITGVYKNLNAGAVRPIAELTAAIEDVLNQQLR
jgi:hypothetical protein